MSSIVWKLVGPGAGILATAVASRVTKKAWVASWASSGSIRQVRRRCL